MHHCYSVARIANFFFFVPWAVLNPHQAINPPPGHSTSLSLYFSSFLHGEAWLIWLSMMEDRKVEGKRKVFGSFSQIVTQTNGSTRWVELFDFGPFIVDYFWICSPCSFSWYNRTSSSQPAIGKNAFKWANMIWKIIFTVKSLFEKRTECRIELLLIFWPFSTFSQAVPSCRQCTVSAHFFGFTFITNDRDKLHR